MLRSALRYPLAGRQGRDALAVCVGLFVVALLLVRAAAALWPTALSLMAAAGVAVPTVLFAGYLAAVLETGTERGSDDAKAPRFAWSRGTLRDGLRAVAVGGVYLSPGLATLLGAVFLLLETGASPGGNPLLAVAPTVALFALVGCAYVLPAGVATGVRAGVRAGLRRSAFAGLVSGGYFVAWTAGVATLAVAWSVPGAVGIRSPLAVVGAAVTAYGTVVATRLFAVGLARSRWEPPA